MLILQVLILIGIPLLIILLILIQSFFANSEMSIVSSNRIHLKYLAKNGDKNAMIVQNLLNNPDRLFSTTLLAINIATVSVSLITKFYFYHLIENYFQSFKQYFPAEVIIIIIMEPIILIFGELLPMSIARKYPNTTATRNAVIIRSAYLFLFPFMTVLSFISKKIGNLFQKSKSSFITREELQLLVTGKFSKINYKTQEYIKEVFNINELTAEDVMVHLDKVIAVEENASVKEVKEIITKTTHSRIPVYRNDIFNITATVHALNLLGIDDGEPIMTYTDRLYIVPSSKPILQILKELKGNRKYMGIVVDEYGSVCGIITLKDILKEIMGEITDDINSFENNKKIVNENTFDAQMKLDDFYDKTGIDFTGEDAETLAGIINLAIGRIARTKEIITYKNATFEIVEATDRVVKLIKLIDK